MPVGPNPPPPEWLAGTVKATGTGLAINSGTLNASGGTSEWTAGTVTTLGTNLALAGGTLSASGGGTSEWTAGTVTTLGTNLALAGGTLSASGGGSDEWQAGTINAVGAGLVAVAGTPHRYWRMLFPGLGAGGYNGMENLVMSATIGGANILTGGTAVAYATAGGFTAAGALTGYPGWLSSFTPNNYWQYDLGAGNAASVAEVTFFPATLGGPASFVLSYSDDNVTFTNLATFTCATWVGGTSQSFFPPVSTSLNALWQAGTVTLIGPGLAIIGGELLAEDTWTAGPVTSLGGGLSLASGVISALWQAGTITAIGTGLTITAGTLHT